MIAGEVIIAAKGPQRPGVRVDDDPSDLTYMIVVLRPDQLDLIAEAVAARLFGRQVDV